MIDKYAPPPDYLRIEDAAWIKARDAAEEKARIKAFQMLMTAKDLSLKTGLSMEETLAHVQADEMIASLVASSPLRSDLHRREAARWLKSLPWVTDFEKLPVHGAKALRISTAGAIEAAARGKRLPGHALNFRWRCAGRTFYAMQKHIKSYRGHRRGRHNEMIGLLERFAKSRATDVVLLVIADGDYYQQNDGAKLKELREHARTKPPRSHALPTDEVPALLQEYAGE